MDDCPKELSDMKRHDLPSDNEWELEVRRVLLAKIERLQRELDIAKHLALKESKMNRELHLQMHACGGALSKAQGDLLRAERERDEARAIIERWRGLLNEAANALGREHEGLVGEICVALGGEG